ncbi:MAG: SMP-30/gluconolactonase/LRE family protein [Pseudomonadales bacterium]|nr:SMP-30/gluconolactonase/LRE family protein [Pseudomonadales bacterium]
MTRTDGIHQLLVVNHGGREAVEFFALNDSEGSWQLEWKGCALPPEDPFINDVAGLSDGGFLVTHMWNKSQPFEAVVDQILAGVKTGWVWAWDPEAGFSKLAGSEEQMPNGIVVSKDNRSVFVNIYIGNKTIKLDRLSGELLGEFAVQQPDNITLDDHGQLWIASHKHNPIEQNCNNVEFGPCLLPFDIVRADPETMEAEVILSHNGTPMGYSTVALRVGDEIFMGSAHGDRVVSIDYFE